MDAEKTHYGKDTLLAYLQESLNAERASLIERHLNNCEICRKSIDDLAECDHHEAVSCDDYPKSIRSKGGKCYSVRRVLASGGMGTIYEAFDEQLHREIAIKVVKFRSKNYANSIRFKREARITSQLQHPGIAPVHEMGQTTGGQHYIVMKLVGGETMRSIMNRVSKSRDNSITQLLDIFLQICKTIGYAHANGIVHRDIKPENIMVGSFGEVQVLDWGIAKSLDFETVDTESELIGLPIASNTTTRSSSVIGTPSYMSPEQATGQPIDHTTDLYALGMILAEILVGHYPKAELNGSKEIGEYVMTAHECTLDQLSKCERPKQLVDLAAKCISPNPSGRPSTAFELQQTISHYFTDQSQQLRKMELDQERADAKLSVERKRRRQVSFLAAISVGIFACATLASVLYFQERSHRKNEQHRIELVQLQKRNRIESQVNSAISNAQTLLDKSAALGDEEARLAYLKEGFSATQSVSKLLDSNLKSDLHQQLLQIQKELTQQIESSQTKIEFEEKRQIALRRLSRLIDRSRQPGLDMNFMRNPELLSDVEKWFAHLGIELYADAKSTANHLAEYELSDDLLAGLRLWRMLLQKQNSSNRNETKIQWVNSLNNLVDNNQFRSNLRQFEMDRDLQSIIDASRSSEATASLASAHLTSDCILKMLTREQQLSFLIKAQRKYPNDEKLNWRLATCFRHLRYYEEAVRYYLICHSLAPENLAALFDLCFCLSNSQRHDECLDYAFKIIDLAPKYPQTYLTIAINLFKLNQPELAEAFCYQALQIDPGNANGYYNLSLMLQARGQHGLALAAGAQAMKLAPRAKHIVNCATIYNQSEDNELAIDMLENAIYRSPGDHRFMQKLGKIYSERGQHALAACFYEPVFHIFPNRLNVRENYARELVASGNFEDATLLIFSSKTDIRHNRNMQDMINHIAEPARIARSTEESKR